MQYTFGYARVSANDQKLATQVNDLTHAGCTRIFTGEGIGHAQP